MLVYIICIYMSKYRIKKVYTNGKIKYIPQKKIVLCYYKDIVEEDTAMVFYTLESCIKYINEKILSECDLVIYVDTY